MTSELAAPCMDVSLNNNERNSCSSAKCVFQSDNNITPFLSFKGTAYAYACTVSSYRTGETFAYNIFMMKLGNGNDKNHVEYYNLHRHKI